VIRAVRPLDQQTILITGATDGLGRSLAAELAATGATLLIHGRDEQRGRETIAQIKAGTGNQKLRWLRADFASLAEVRAMAESVARDCHRLDALVNNAGIGATTSGEVHRFESRDGHELRFAVNYLAGYLLTRRLLPLLEQSAPARIVNVSSAGQAAIDFDDVMLERGYDGVRAYCQSKLAQIMFTLDLAEELKHRGVTATCLHPATYMPTKMVLAGGINPTSSLEEGVRAVRRLVADPEMDGVTGRYYSGQQPADPHPQAPDIEARRTLQRLSDRICGVDRARS
jgi:NAD(P)-dependent dehydrogenase (short-subunit alcohol dehydrogenase family)